MTGSFQAPHGFPATFDVVVVSDVLYYIPWGGWMPVLHVLGMVPRFLYRPSQQRFYANLASMARKAVVFSNHQGNRIALDFFHAIGAQKIDDVWIVNGTALDSALSPPGPGPG